MIFFFSFSEVCVDKARIDEYEQRASELAQKASITAYIFSPQQYHHMVKTKPTQNPKTPNRLPEIYNFF